MEKLPGEITVETLRQTALFRRVSLEVLAQLASLSSRHNYQRGDIIFERGSSPETLHILTARRGVAMVCREHKQKQRGKRTDSIHTHCFFSYLGKDDLAGEFWLFDHDSSRATVLAKNRVETIGLPIKKVKAICDAEPEFWKSLGRLVLRKVNAYLMPRAIDAGEDAEKVLKKRLKAIAHQFGKSATLDPSDRRDIPFFITDQEIAWMVGLRPATVRPLLTQLEDAKVITRDRNNNCSTVVPKALDDHVWMGKKR